VQSFNADNKISNKNQIDTNANTNINNVSSQPRNEQNLNKTENQKKRKYPNK